MLTIVFEDEQYHNEQIKLGFRINELCFGSVYNAHNFNLHGDVSIVIALSVATNFEIVWLLIQLQQSYQSNLPKMKAVNYS